MLVICNGAIKSGSTWLYNILANLVSYEQPPDRYLTENSRKRQRNFCIQPELLKDFLEQEDVVQTNYLSKNHIGRPEHRDLLMRNHHVFVFDIERDIRDMVVSSYYDARNRSGYEGAFADYYWAKGRYVADEVNRYHATWRNAGDRFCMVSYEGLHADFCGEAQRIAATLGQTLDANAASKLQEKTSIGSLRKRYNDEDLYKGNRFFRKGVIGDWQNHFDKKMLKDIRRIETHGMPLLDRRRLARKIRSKVDSVLSRHA